MVQNRESEQLVDVGALREQAQQLAVEMRPITLEEATCSRGEMRHLAETACRQTLYTKEKTARTPENTIDYAEYYEYIERVGLTLQRYRRQHLDAYSEEF